MAVSLLKQADISMTQKWQDMKENKSSSNQRSKAWTETKSVKTDKKVPVVYYLSRNNQLDHPHFMVVRLSSPQGLYLKDVISKLSSLRGQGIATMYSWSSKRSYKNGFVWQDLSDNDFIYPCQGHEYVIKGSQLLESSLSFRSFESTVSSNSSSSSSSLISRETGSPVEEHSNVDPAIIIRRKNQSWSSFDGLGEYQVYKPKITKELASKGTNVSTQTDEKVRPRKSRLSEVSGPERNGELESSPKEFEGSRKDQTVENGCECGKTKASTVLMQLITCGSTKIKDSGPIKSKD
ncbi:protein SOSEKI 5-like [Humulus lupulus]|uniref:protein SOSEKI 5-like n=1 Tax=Humulus lupulus TaxID=3486 RepID=UPI002B409148|nr:protein SOSEKI 5-like [Humulus lupulus]